MSTLRAVDDGKFSQRALTEQDAAAYVALTAAIGAADGDTHRLDEPGYLKLLHHPLASRDQEDFSGLFDGGRLVAAGWVARRSVAEPVHWMRASGGVHPEYRGRGLGTALIRWQQALTPRIHERFFPGRALELSVGAVGGNGAARELFENEGFEPLRRHFDMRLPEGAPVADATAPDGFEFAPFPQAGAEEVRLAHNEIFVDHFRSTPWQPQDWTHWIGQDKIRRDLSLLLRERRTGRLAGYLVASFSESESAATGVRDVHFHLIGTRRAHRGHGIASALIARAVRTSRELGFQTASLGVDAENPTGAVGVYERAGFKPAREWITYNKVVSAARD